VLLHADSVHRQEALGYLLQFIYQALTHVGTAEFDRSLSLSLLSQHFICVMRGHDHLKIRVESYTSKLAC